MDTWVCRYCGCKTYGPFPGNGGFCSKNGLGGHKYVNANGCFITTAVCQTLGAPDDCKELTMIRNFRDTRLKPLMEDGELLVKEYYRIGPMVVDAIKEDENASEIYTRLWNECLKLCCEQIEQKEWEQAKLSYIKMVRELCEKYNIDVDPTIKEKYFV